MKFGQKSAKTGSEAVLRCLAEVPFCTVEACEVNEATIAGEADAIARVRLPDGPHDILIQSIDRGQPRHAREAVNNLLRLQRQKPEAYLIFVAPYITPLTAELAQAEGVGCVDLSGNCRLCFGHIYIRRDGFPNLFAQKRELRSLYSPKAERILRTLLLEPKRAWKIQDIASAAKVSLGQASNVKKLLLDHEWIASTPDGIALTAPANLLDEWAENYQFQRHMAYEFLSLDPMALLEAKLAAVCESLHIPYAFTSFSAAARTAPLVRYQRATAYVAGDIAQVANRAGLKSASSGANVSLLEPYDVGVLAGSRDVFGVRIASAVQTYLDVRSLKGRGAEAAQAVYDLVIAPTWS
jgi:hypothetical protein